MLQSLMSLIGAIDRYRFASSNGQLIEDLSFTQASARFGNRNDLYRYMHRHFFRCCPAVVRSHRAYYRKSMRGFGEDALHAMWFTLLREFKPATCLEIGVYRGQVISLWGLIARYCNFQCDIHGISPFSPAGDDVSVYLKNLDYMEDTLQSVARFGLPAPHFVRALSTDHKARAHIQSRSWDLIYIDGSHDFDVVFSDYCASIDALKSGGLLVLDDSSLTTDFTPPRFSFGGHPGPSRVMVERAMRDLKFLGGVGHNNVFQKA